MRTTRRTSTMLAMTPTRQPAFRRTHDRRAVAATIVVAAAAVALAWALPERAVAKKAPLAPPCAGGRFVVLGEPLIPGAAAAVVGAADAFQVGGGQVTLLGGCGAASARIKATRKGTRLRATWPSCPGLRGRVTMRALIAPTCGQVAGKMKAKGYKHPFTATLRGPVCGDGVLDAGEQCEPPGENGCDAHCALAPPSDPGSGSSTACGDGTLDPDEVCDDGNNTACDGCAAD